MVAEITLSGGGFKDIDLEEISKWPAANYVRNFILHTLPGQTLTIVLIL